MSQQSEIYSSYLNKFYKTHKEVELKRIKKPDLKGAIAVDCVYVCSSIFHIFKLKDGQIVSGQTTEFTRGFFSRWFEGTYRQVSENTPMSHSQYFEF